MREPKRAEERKSIPIQSESDKPEQCIVQTYSITQSHTHTRMWKHSHTNARTHWVKCASSSTSSSSIKALQTPIKHRNL